MRFFLQGRARESLVSFFKRAPDGVNLSGNRGYKLLITRQSSFRFFNSRPLFCGNFNPLW